MIIKATRLQTWAPAGGGGGRVGRRLPPSKKSFWAILGAFLLLFLHIWGPFCYVFLFWGVFLLLFTSWWWPFFGLAPPPMKISAGAHDCKEGSRACSPEIVLCDRNLVSSGQVLLRFGLKNDKNNDNL